MTPNPQLQRVAVEHIRREIEIGRIEISEEDARELLAYIDRSPKLVLEFISAHPENDPTVLAELVSATYFFDPDLFLINQRPRSGDALNAAVTLDWDRLDTGKEKAANGHFSNHAQDRLLQMLDTQYVETSMFKARANGRLPDVAHALGLLYRGDRDVFLDTLASGECKFNIRRLNVWLRREANITIDDKTLRSYIQTIRLYARDVGHADQRGGEDE